MDRRYRPNLFDQWIEHYKEQYPHVHIPVKREVCPSCDGNGRYVNPSIDDNGITQDEWLEWGDEEREMYFSGGYDVICNECNGRNVVDRLDDNAPAEMLDDWREYEADYYDLRAIEAAERRAGC